MPNTLPIPDGHAEAGKRYPMAARPGSHVTYIRGADVVVEWYDFGEHAPYESANLLVFDPLAQRGLLKALHIAADCLPDLLAAQLPEHFSSYFKVKAFAQKHGIAFAKEVDFWP